jgi:uncharacterized protein (TIGR03790 family)
VIFAAILAMACLARAALAPEEVVVVFNKREHGSEDIARYYALSRGVPEQQVVGLPLPVNEMITRWEYDEQLRDPINAFLEEKKLWKHGEISITATNGAKSTKRVQVTRSAIRCLVLCRGVPLKIAGDPGLKEPGLEELRPEFQRNEAAVDSELTLLPLLKARVPLSGPLRNELYATTNAAAIHPTNGVLMVARLDGRTVEIARGLVDKALQAERDGYWGRAYFDLRSPSEPGMKQGDEWIRNASEISRVLGFETVVDESPATLRPGFPMSHVLLYFGWYTENMDGPFLNPDFEFMPGALAYHLHSFSAATLRSGESQWVGPLLERGATLSLGTVHEPYLGGTPDVAVLLARFGYSGFSYGEATLASQSVLSWMTTLVGDPMFQPWRLPPQERLQQLQESKSPLEAWWHLRRANLNLAQNAPMETVALYIEQQPITKTSAVLNEKLADLYTRQGKPASALHALQTALELDPSTQQRLRLRLALAERLEESERPADAFACLDTLLDENPHYPDSVTVRRRMLSLARKAGDDAAVKRMESLLQPPPAN